ncbi:MAG: biotin--[acetyl-CoA-carboxylase] ligase [Candidatus Bathyarchaeia archaeon]
MKIPIFILLKLTLNNNEFKILWFKTVDSTNNIAKKLAEEGFEEGTIIVAETQTKGRGRYRRTWFSPKGGLWFSIILRPEMSPNEVFKLNFLTTLSIVKAINDLYNLKAEIKWPNDVLINGKKVCGVLNETKIKDGKLEFVILGIGMNVNIPLEVFPKELRKTSTSLKILLRENVPIMVLLQKILKNIFFYYSEVKKNFIQILNEYKCFMKMLNSWIEINVGNKKMKGQVIDVNEETGALIVKLRNNNFQEIFDINNCRIKLLTS